MLHKMMLPPSDSALCFAAVKYISIKREAAIQHGAATFYNTRSFLTQLQPAFRVIFLPPYRHHLSLIVMMMPRLAGARTFSASCREFTEMITSTTLELMSGFLRRTYGDITSADGEALICLPRAGIT